MHNIQLNNGQLQHLLCIEGLSRQIIEEIFARADSFLDLENNNVKKTDLLNGKTICNLFFENSTRTRTTFEIAAKKLSADVINLNVSTSSQSKGESILDTVNNLIAMHADMFVIRHNQSGAAHFIAKHINKNINLPIFFVNENYSSTSAEEFIKDLGNKKQKNNNALVDQVAANIILQSHFNEVEKQMRSLDA